MSVTARHAIQLSASERALLDRVPDGLLIDGWRPAADGRTFRVEDPATGAWLADVADASPEDALEALALADAAGPSWAAATPFERSDLLRRLHDGVLERMEDFASLIALEMGKPLEEARGEVRYGAGYLRWYAEEATRIGGRTLPDPAGRSSISTSRSPVGVCLLITPWNFPLAMALRKIAPALAAGCTAVLKPAELTPLTVLLFGELFRACGGPPGVLTIVTTTDPAPVSRRLMDDPRTRKVSFTGSTAVGQTLIAQSAANVMRTSMELGGNAPLIVFEDADLDVAVDEAMIAKLRNGGQSCVAANRILVQDAIADAFIERFVARLQDVRVGRGSDPATQLGPVIDQRAVSKIVSLVGAAVDGGARLLCGGGRPEGAGSFVPPTALEVSDLQSPILREEVFGPVAPIVRFADEQEGVAIANDTPFGLAAYIFTQDLDRAGRVAGQLRSGMVAINQGVVSNVAAPFGGVGLSGLGREGGPEGIDEYLDLKYVCAPAATRSTHP